MTILTNIWDKMLLNGGKLLSVIVAFLAPIQGVLLAVGAFIILDSLIGVWRAKKVGQKITSRRLSRIIRKMLVYQSTVITFFLLDYFIVNEFVLSFFSIEFALTKIIAVILIGIEIFSIDESFKAATGNGLFGHFKKLIGKIKETKKDVNSLKDDNEIDPL